MANRDYPLFRNAGSVAVCRGCGCVLEGTASFAIGHVRDCGHARAYSALIAEGAPSGPAADAVCRLLGERKHPTAGTGEA